MTHYNVLVIGNDWEKQLIPFEDISGEDSPYSEFEDHSEEWIEEWTKKIIEKNEVISILDWVRDWHGGSEFEGKMGFWRNPNGKWDWFMMGGRWSGMLQVRDGSWAARGECGVMESRWSEAGWDQCRLGDVDLGGIQKINTQRTAELWDKAKEKVEKAGLEHAKAVYGLDPSKTTKEELVNKIEEKFPTFRVILKHGVWHEIERKNWFESTEKERKKWEKICNSLFEDIDPDTLITVVDCHN